MSSLKDSTLRVINSLDGSGVAVVIAPTMAVTAAHLITAATRFTDVDGAPIGGTVAKLFVEEDLAFITLDRTLPHARLVDFEAGQSISAFGLPAVETVNGLWAEGTILGQVSIDGHPRLQLRSAELTHGFSGCGLFTPVGVVGIFSSIIDQRDGIEGRLTEAAFAVPARTVVECAARIGVRLDVEATVSASTRTASFALEQSRARCFARLRATGISDSIARELTYDDAVGSFPDVQDVLDNGGLRIVLGEFGVGKSLGLERALMRTAADEVQHNRGRRIVYFDARSPGIETVLADAEVSGERTAIFIDNAEGLGETALRRLRDRVRQLLFLRAGTSIIVTSRPGRAFSEMAEALSMPPFSEETARLLMERITPGASRQEFVSQDSSALTRPLFAILAALHPDIGHRLLARGDLLVFFAEKVFNGLEVEDGSAGKLLRRLAVLQTDAGGELVRIADVAPTMSRNTLQNSGYLTYDASRALIGFTLPILTQWFAAAALESDDISLDTFAGDELRLENWREVFMVRVAMGSDVEVDELFEDLSAISPGFAVSLAQREVGRWFNQSSLPQPTALQYGRRLRRAMDVLLTALGKYGRRPPYADEHGTLALGVRITNKGQLETGWSFDRAHEVFELPDSFSTMSPTPGFSMASYRAAIDVRPAWNWRSASKNIGKLLLKSFEFREYQTVGRVADGIQVSFRGTVHERELAWQTALALLGKGSLHPDALRIDDLKRYQLQPGSMVANGLTRFYDSHAYNNVLADLVARAAEFMEPPWPTPKARARFVWGGYREEDLLERIRVVYTGALELYEKLVHECFGALASRMPLFAAMPFVFKVVLTRFEDDMSGPIGEWTIEPLQSGINSVVVQRGPSTPIFSLDRSRYLSVVSRRPEFASYAAFPTVHGRIHVFGDLPIAELAYDWLTDDIKRLFGL